MLSSRRARAGINGQDEPSMRELSLLAIVLGSIIGAFLAAANAFVGLKVGMTISASIPAAVLSLLILRVILKRSSLLESNIVQTVGSAGESLAAGMIFTLPALFILGHDPAYLSMVIWGAIGGLLGVCFMVPLRHVLIVKEHGVLPYPEGVACAEVLESGERGGAGAKCVIWGAVVGGAFYLLNALRFWEETGRIAIRRFRTEAQLDSSPALLGVGYILGARVASYMLSGAIFSWFVLIPAIAFFAGSSAEPIFPELTRPVADMAPGDLYARYVRYVGAGAVAIGGLISLLKSFPTIVASLLHVAGSVLGANRGSRSRTEKDFPFVLLLLIIAGLGYAMWVRPEVDLDPIGTVAVLVFTFFFVTVSSRLVGIVGASSNPVSGMTIATLLGTSLAYKFLVLDKNPGMTGDEIQNLKFTCLSVGAIVCIAIAIAGDTSQDLKTGFLVKATPYKQQIGEMIGVLTSVAATAGVLLLLHRTNGFGDPTPEHPHPLPAFQANIMKLLVDGVLGGQVPWTLILIGGAAAVIIEMLGLPALPFAVGMYLPLGLSAPIMVGGLIAWLTHRKQKAKAEHDPGVLTAAGFVAGKGLVGVALAGVTALIAWAWHDPRWLNPLSGHDEPVTPSHFVPWLWGQVAGLQPRWGLSDAWWSAFPMLTFVPLVLYLWWAATRRPTVSFPPPEATPAPPSPPRTGTGAGVGVTKDPLSTAPGRATTLPAAKPAGSPVDPERARLMARLGHGTESSPSTPPDDESESPPTPQP